MTIARRFALLQLLVLAACSWTFCLVMTFDVRAQEQPEKAATIVIPNEPKSVDPGTIYPEKLTKKVTVEFIDKSFAEIGEWLRTQQSISVKFDQRSMSDDGLSVDQPVTERLNDAPIYFLLNRFRQYDLSWYDDGDKLIITTIGSSNEEFTSQCYNIHDLLDQGYRAQDFCSMVEDFVSGPWNDREQPRKATLLGDVLIVRQSYQRQCEVAGLLTALRKNGRRTLTFDASQNEVVREKLNQIVEVNVLDLPLEETIDHYSKEVGITARFNDAALSAAGMSKDQPITIDSTKGSLKSILRRALKDLDLTWQVADGALLITSVDDNEKKLLTAVFDVRDLCRDRIESANLVRMIQTQTGGHWIDVRGKGGRVICPIPGMLLVRQTEQQLDEISSLLEKYRQSLGTIGRRVDVAEGPQSLTTRYYRLQRKTAIDLQSVLPKLVSPESWKSTERPDVLGTLDVVESISELVNPSSRRLPGSEPPKLSEKIAIPMSVLIIRQTRENHREIEKVLQKIEQGDAGNGVTKLSEKIPAFHMTRTEDELPLQIVQLDADAVKEFETGPYQNDFDGPKIECDLVDSFLFGPDDYIIAQIQRTVHERSGVGFGGPSFKLLERHIEAMIAISPDRLRDRMLICTRTGAAKSSFVRAFRYSQTEIAVVVRTQTEDPDKDDDVYLWNLPKDELTRAKFNSQLWHLYEVIDHKGAVSIGELGIRQGRLDIIAAVTNQKCVLEFDTSCFYSYVNLGIAPLGRRSLLPTSDPTSFIDAQFTTKSISCVDPTCKRGIRWEKDRSSLEQDLGHGVEHFSDIPGTSRPANSCHFLFSGKTNVTATYARWSTATGVLERLCKIPVGKEWNREFHDKAAVSKDARWLALISNTTKTDHKLRVYDLENDASFVFMPLDQNDAGSWADFKVIGIRNNDNVLLQSKGGFWEVDLRTARVRQRIFELPRRSAEKVER